MSIHIVVCVKSVVKSAPRGVARRTPENSELNPYDRPAIEAALRLKESQGGSVTVLTMGPPPVSLEILSEARAMGADKAVLVSDPALAESDTLATSKTLAAAITKLGSVDLLFFGTRTADSDTGQVGPQTAALLGMPFVSRAKAVSPNAEGWEMLRTMDGWEERWQIDAAGGAATIDSTAFFPRPVGLVGISRAYEDLEIIQWSLPDLDLKPEEVGLTGSPTRVDRLEKIKRSRKCDMLEGDPRTQATELITRLTREGAMG